MPEEDGTVLRAMAEKTKAVHILAFPFPTPEHINSLMYMCNRLADIEPSFKITYISLESSKEVVLRTRAFASVEEEIDIVGLPVLLSNSLEVSKLKAPLEHLIADP